MVCSSFSLLSFFSLFSFLLLLLPGRLLKRSNGMWWWCVALMVAYLLFLYGWFTCPCGYGLFFFSYHLSSPLMSVSVAHRKVEWAEFRFRSAALCAVDGCGYLNLKPVQWKSWTARCLATAIRCPICLTILISCAWSGGYEKVTSKLVHVDRPRDGQVQISETGLLGRRMAVAQIRACLC